MASRRSQGWNCELMDGRMPVPMAVWRGVLFKKCLWQRRLTTRTVSSSEVLHLINCLQEYQVHVPGCPCVCTMLLRGGRPIGMVGSTPPHDTSPLSSLFSLVCEQQVTVELTRSSSAGWRYLEDYYRWRCLGGSRKNTGLCHAVVFSYAALMVWRNCWWNWKGLDPWKPYPSLFNLEYYFYLYD